MTLVCKNVFKWYISKSPLVQEANNTQFKFNMRNNTNISGHLSNIKLHCDI